MSRKLRRRPCVARRKTSRSASRTISLLTGRAGSSIGLKAKARTRGKRIWTKMLACRGCAIIGAWSHHCGGADGGLPLFAAAPVVAGRLAPPFELYWEGESVVAMRLEVLE